jgi:hypothetical protein
MSRIGTDQRAGTAGFSLVEMLFVVGCMGLVLVMVSGLLYNMHSILRDTDQSGAVYEAVYRFVPRIKADAGRSIGAETAPGRIVFTLAGGGRVVYRETSAGWTRSEKPLGKERMIAPAWLKAEFGMNPAERGGEDVLTLRLKNGRTGEALFFTILAIGG